jgi:cold shock protein
VAVEGVVREWSDEHGWGVVDAAETPGGCWVHFSMVAVHGFRALRPGQAVELEFERLDFLQDGHPFRAVRVWPAGERPAEPEPPGPPSSAYRSTLTITFDAPELGQTGPGDGDAGRQ